MITNKVLIKLLNEQIRNELESHQIYLAMAAWFETTAFKGFTARYYAAAQEEHGHAMKFFNFLADRDGRIEILPLPAPKFSYRSPAEAAATALKQEQRVSAQIRKIYAAAEKVGDYETKEFLSWFLKEQIEEERVAKDFLEYVEAAGSNAAALIELDEQARSEAKAGGGHEEDDED